jgi:probable F420-dependent oxidoreductase
MKFGIALPSCTEGLCYPVPFTGPDVLTRIAVEAERLGYDSVWCNDHLTTQRYVRRRWPQPPSYYDPFVALSFVAAATGRVRLGTSVVVLPMRDPVVVAKQASTLDVFSGGRLILGVGVGAYREEFEAVLPRQRAARRGEMVDEGIQALRALFADGVADFGGQHYEFHDVEMYPKPLQNPLPIWVAGNAAQAAARVGRWCEGWLPAVLPAEQIWAAVDRLRRSAEAAGRDPNAIEIAPQFVMTIAPTHEAAVRRFRESWLYYHLLSLKNSTLKDQDLSVVERYNLIGTPDGIAEKIEEFREAGVSYCASLAISAATVEDLIEQMQYFAEDVVPRFRRAASMEAAV